MTGERKSTLLLLQPGKSKGFGHRRPWPLMFRTLTYLTAYTRLHLPLFVLYMWPLFVGGLFHLGMLSVGLWVLWCVPFTFVVHRLSRQSGWIDLRTRVQSLDRGSKAGRGVGLNRNPYK